MLIYKTQSIPCHMSHVTCHVSRVACHMSHVACRMSHNPCRMSHVIWLLSGQFLFVRKLEYTFESSNLYWDTKEKKKTRTTFHQRRTGTFGLEGGGDLIARKKITQCPKASVLYKRTQIAEKQKR